MPDRTAGRGAELIPPERLRPALIEELACVESVVPEKFEDASVEAVRSSAGDGADDAACGASVFGGVILRQHAELTDGVHAKIVARNAAGRETRVVVNVRAVQQEGLKVPRRAGDRHLCPRTIGHDRGRSRTRAGELRDARLQERQRFVAPSVQRQIANLLVADQSGKLCTRGLHQRHFTSDRQTLRQLSHFGGQIHHRLAADSQRNAFSDDGAKPCETALNHIRTRIERGHTVTALVVANYHASGARLAVDDLDANTGQDCAGLIVHDSGNRRRGTLTIDSNHH